MRLDRTGGTIHHTGTIHIIGSIAVGLVAGTAGQFISLRAEINLFAWIEREVRSCEETCLGVWSLPAVDAILEAFLICKARIAFAELDVGDVSIDLFIPAQSQAVERMIVAVCSELLSLKITFIFADRSKILFRTCQHRLEVFMILAGE